MKEQWKQCPNWDGLYEISNKSRIKNSITGRVLKPYLHYDNYYRLCFYRDGLPKYLRRSRMVALTWIPNPENKKEVNHKNGITTDDRPINLEWVHPSENILHYYYKLDKGAKRAVKLFTMGNKFIKKYPSISMALRDLGLPMTHCGNVVTHLKGKNHYAYGFKWKYA